MKNTIIACGKEIEVSCPVIKWTDPNGFSFIKSGKYNHHNYTFDQLKSTLKSFTLHHSVTFDAKTTYNVLLQRGLSVNFIIGDDCKDENGYATLYQCMDLKDAGWSQGNLNDVSRGVEISYRPERWQFPHLYDGRAPKHPALIETIHGVKMNVFGPSDPQVKTLIELCAGICQLFDIVPSFPKDNKGEYLNGLLQNPLNYKGLVRHAQIDKNKIDPCGLDLKFIERCIGEILLGGKNIIDNSVKQG